MTTNPNILIYQKENGNIKVDIRFEEGELDAKSFFRNYQTTITKVENG
jgi:hypothetical protein